ncbi:putative transcriptional regulator, CopG family [Thermodesulfatator indicus DSM 15286]|uniref:Transcriptional regulator, CopG family n=1 Tax=Thermodesulfatator indicus (strain DSM 15286 / JCM 11887 / CIR29812) TaxID=667014 RepID=F8AB10_THEID|nr:TM1266 family iron-only hydrogenase system putative regulator [Thermodesulfatator indicus]AEH44376.1 putative transcriptional regulator, CopG family [Thermodesulfatator indicus DSM 15286]
MEKRIGVVAILVKDRKSASQKVNEILSEYGDLIIGRIGLPYKERGINIISVIVEATTDEIGAFTGKLGAIPAVEVKSLLVTK